jgi:hypothetical protein
MSLTSEFQELSEGRKIQMGRRRDENRKGDRSKTAALFTVEK